MRVIWFHGMPGWGVEQFSGQGVEGLTDLELPDPEGVEYQPVGEGAALQMRADRVDGGLDVGQPLPVPVALTAQQGRGPRVRGRPA